MRNICQLRSGSIEAGSAVTLVAYKYLFLFVFITGNYELSELGLRYDASIKG